MSKCVRCGFGGGQLNWVGGEHVHSTLEWCVIALGKEISRLRSSIILDELTQEAQEMGLGYNKEQQNEELAR